MHNGVEHMRKRNSTHNQTMALQLIQPFIALAKSYGYPDTIGFVQNYFGLSKAEMEDPDTRLPVQRVVDLFSALIADTKNRDLGLIGAQLVDAEHMGIGEFIARSRPTVREAFESGARYTRLLGDGAKHGVVFDGKVARWRIQLDPSLVVPVFACPIRFGMPVTQIVMSTKFLERQLASAEPGLGRLLEREANTMLQKLPPSGDLIAQVLALVGQKTRLRDASAERVARQLGMAPRTLARKLNEQGTSYRELIEDMRKRLALRELAETSRPISEISFQLGFSCTQSFHRSFRRWTGTSAGKWRERRKSRGEKRG